LLTGTPLQNNLQELISLLTFIMPEIFSGSDELLKSFFKSAAGNDAMLQQRIQKARGMLTPFILRRKKSQVHFFTLALIR
jgi:SWI/SNF-related matrix-associated actin-dependent regulator 1 of chromatin subfamily A